MLSTYQHLLIPLDLSSNHDGVLASAIELGNLSNASVTLLHVIEPIEEPGDSETEKFTEQLIREAEDHLEKLAQRFLNTGIEVNIENRIGKRAKEVASFAAEKSVDIILLDSHAINPEGGERSISISYQIALLAPCAVLLLKS